MIFIKKILGTIRRAIVDYEMIQDGDKVAIGVSGGKDSLTLLVALRQLQNFLPVKFDLEAITVSMGFDNFDVTPIQELCNKIGVNYTVEETLIGKIIFDERKETNPCSLCANMRRGALNSTAKALGCNKVALAHHYDDVVETTILSTFFEGRFHSFSPVTYLDKKELFVIRPMIYTREKDVKAFVKEYPLTVVRNPCTANGYTKRQYVKDLLAEIGRDNRHIKQNIFGALQRSGVDGWELKI